MSVIQEPTTITSNAFSVIIWWRHVCYFQSTYLLAHILKHILLVFKLKDVCAAGPVKPFPEETYCSKPYQGKFVNHSDSSQTKLIWYYLSSALASAWRKYRKRYKQNIHCWLSWTESSLIAGGEWRGCLWIFRRWTMWLWGSPVKSIINSILSL